MLAYALKTIETDLHIDYCDMTESDLYYVDYLPRIADYFYFEKYLEFVDEKLHRWDMPDGIPEKHHIVPKCYLPKYMTLEETFLRNMVVLSSYEHYVAHYYLARAFNGKMLSAFRRMSYSKKYNQAKLPVEEDASDLLKYN